MIFPDDYFGPVYSLLSETECERGSHISYTFPQTPNENPTLAYHEDYLGNQFPQEQELQLVKLMKLHKLVLYIY
jgi:hypothetical protein